MAQQKDLRLLTTYKCTQCDDGPCYVCTPRVRHYDDDCDPCDYDQITPYYCPVNGSGEFTGEFTDPKFRPILPTHERMVYPELWLTEQLFEWVEEHYEELPQFVRDAAYGELIAPNRSELLRPVDYLRLLANAQSYHCDRIDAFKAVNKATKLQLVNELIPAAFAAGVIYAAIRYSGKSEYDELDAI